MKAVLDDPVSMYYHLRQRKGEFMRFIAEIEISADAFSVTPIPEICADDVAQRRTCAFVCKDKHVVWMLKEAICSNGDLRLSITPGNKRPYAVTRVDRV